MQAFTILAELGERVGYNLWDYKTPDGRSLKKAYEFVVPYLNGEKWPYPEIEQEDLTNYAPYLRVAASQYGEKSFSEAADNVLGSEIQTNRVNLTTPKPIFKCSLSIGIK
ncbi:hypothetical protein GCM10025859_35030 [Alicyclobacillus fastidiosus]|nr:hypothetical protein GCM10025859_35030 [Alicyclobacillus fastidiosus]